MSGFLDGLMLGDGSLGMHGKLSARLQVGRQIAHADYNEWVMSKFPELTWQEPWCHEAISYINGRKIQGHQHRIRSRNSPVLAQVYARWYPEHPVTGARIRAIPNDFSWTPEALAVAMMDDGSVSCILNKNLKKPQVSAISQLYVCNFTESEVTHLAQGLRDTFGLKCSVQKNRDKPIITFSGIPQVTRLLEIIEPTVKEVPVMGYKFDLASKLAAKHDLLLAG
jgi:hypothetical protein